MEYPIPQRGERMVQGTEALPACAPACPGTADRCPHADRYEELIGEKMERGGRKGERGRDGKLSDHRRGGVHRF